MLKKFLPIFLTLVLAFAFFSVGASAAGNSLFDFVDDSATSNSLKFTYPLLTSSGFISSKSSFSSYNLKRGHIFLNLDPSTTYTIFLPCEVVSSYPYVQWDISPFVQHADQTVTEVSSSFGDKHLFSVIPDNSSDHPSGNLVNGFAYYTFTTSDSWSNDAGSSTASYLEIRRRTYIDSSTSEDTLFTDTYPCIDIYIKEGTISDATVPVRAVYSSKPVSIPAGYALCLYSEDGHTVEGRLSSSSLGYAGYGDKTFTSGQYAFESNSYISAGRLSDNSGTGNDIHWYVPDNINSSLFHKVHIGECLIHFSGHDYYYIVNPSAYTDGNVWYSNGSILFIVSPESGFTWAKLIPLRSDSILNEAGQVFELGDFYDLYDDPVSGALTPSLGENSSSGILYGDTGTATTVEPNNQYSEITLPNNDNFFNSLTRGITNIVDYLKSFISFFPDLFAFLPSELVSLLVGFFAVVLGVILIKFLL